MGAGTVSGELQCGERAPNNCMIVLLVRSVMAPDARGGGSGFKSAALVEVPDRVYAS